MKKFTAVLSIFLFSASFVPAQSVLVRIVPFTVENIRADEGRLIESLVASYISDMDGFTIFSGSAGEDAEKAPHDYDLSGLVAKEHENRVLTLTLRDMRRTEQKMQAYSYRSISELALNVRVIVEDFFPRPSRGRLRNSDEVLPIGRYAITGTWQGDNGVEMLRFFPTGRAFAIFSTGASMELTWVIEDRTLVITQASPNNYRYYYPVPESVARQIAQNAAPMVWKMFLYDKGGELRGTLESTDAEFDETNSVTRYIHGKIQKSRWRKLSG